MNSRLRWRSRRRVDLAGEQIDPGQQAEPAMAFVLMIPREARMAAWHWRQIRCRRGDGLDPRLLVVRDDRDRLLRFLRLGSGFFRDLDLAVDTQNFRHLGLELGVAAFQIGAHLVRLDFLFDREACTRCLEPDGRDIGDPPPVRARARRAKSRVVHSSCG